MSFAESAITALKALKSNKARSFLTMLGIIIGVFAVVSLVSLVQGVKNYVVDQFNAIGSNLVLVAPGRFSFSSDPAIAFSNNKLQEKDADDINRKAASYIVAATPNIRLSKTIKYKSKNYLANVVGSNERFTEITDFEIAKGRTFTKAEVDSSARVVVIAPQIVKNLFGTVDPINKTIKIADVNFVVVGVTKSKGVNADDRVIAPYTSLMTNLKISKLSGITIKAKAGEDIDTVMGKIELILLNNHKPDEFSVISQKDILKSFQNILNTLSIGLGTIAGISLLVGGIGIMNIMLVSVNERISEIGLRKALGATPRNIATQFIFESSFLSIAGGLIGIVLGMMLSFAIKSFVRAEVPLWSIAISFGFSLAVGVLFGSYPAIVASKKDPVESLRYES